MGPQTLPHAHACRPWLSSSRSLADGICGRGQRKGGSMEDPRGGRGGMEDPLGEAWRTLGGRHGGHSGAVLSAGSSSQGGARGRAAESPASLEALRSREAPEGLEGQRGLARDSRTSVSEKARDGELRPGIPFLSWLCDPGQGPLPLWASVKIRGLGSFISKDSSRRNR